MRSRAATDLGCPSAMISVTVVLPRGARMTEKVFRPADPFGEIAFKSDTSANAILLANFRTYSYPFSSAPSGFLSLRFDFDFEFRVRFDVVPECL